MIYIGNKSYSGYIVEQEGEVDAIIHTTDYINDVIRGMENIKVIVHQEADEKRAIPVNYFMGAREASKNIYCLRFGTKPTLWDLYDKVLKEQSDMIDALLAMSLEG